MQRGIVMTEDLEDGKSNLNKSDPGLEINRGVELMLRNRRKPPEPKTFEVKFGKMVSLFRREYHFFIELHFDVRKKVSRKEEKC